MIRIALLSAASALALGACAGPKIDAVRSTQTGETTFDAALTREYRELALYEADKMYDWQDAGRYADKGLKAARGEAVTPDALETRSLPKDQVASLSLARDQLMAALAAGAAEKLPQDAARAQASFDCWLEQQEENHQPDHIAGCRQAFEASFSKLQVALAPPPVAEAPAAVIPAAATVEAPAPAPQLFLIHFALDSAGLSPEAKATLEEALTAAKDKEDLRLTIVGHADRAGSEAHNLELSLARANQVLNALVAGGLPAEHIGVSGLGETAPTVATSDGIPEPANRRVEIELQ